MRLSKRNKRKFKYALRIGEEKVYDENGLFTGDYRQIYSEPKVSYGNVNSGYISANHMSGATGVNDYGLLIDYDKVLMVSSLLGIDEYSHIWLDDLDSPNHDYVVKRIGQSKNHVRVACARVEVS